MPKCFKFYTGIKIQSRFHSKVSYLLYKPKVLEVSWY